jgi:hypothetical protein
MIRLSYKFETDDGDPQFLRIVLGDQLQFRDRNSPFTIVGDEEYVPHPSDREMIKMFVDHLRGDFESVIVHHYTMSFQLKPGFPVDLMKHQIHDLMLSTGRPLHELKLSA